MKYNYHTHTARCFHAKGADEEFVLAAIKAGFDEIGFADHSPWPFGNNYTSGMRMSADELSSYCESIKGLKEKYKEKISIRLGLECEYFPKYIPWLKEQIEKKNIDFVILGHHFCVDEPGSAYNGSLTTPEQLYTYCDDITEAMETGLFLYVAHPDIFMRGYPEFDTHCKEISLRIIEKSKQTGVPLEYNLLGLSHIKSSGMKDYPYPAFWELAAEIKPPVTVGIDAHLPEAYLDSELFTEGLDYLKGLGLEIEDRLM